jgi:hypothetical protein
MIKEIAPIVLHFFQEFGVEFEASFQLIVSNGYGIPNGKRAFAFEFHLKIYQRIFAVLINKAPQSVHLFEHALLRYVQVCSCLYKIINWHGKSRQKYGGKYGLTQAL